MKNKSEKSGGKPQVYKQTELDTMIQLIERGIYSTTNLASVLGVDMDTVTKWKRRPEVVAARTRSILKFAGRRTDVDGVLKELGVDTAQREEKSSLRVVIEDYGTENNPTAKTEGSIESQ